MKYLLSILLAFASFASQAGDLNLTYKLKAKDAFSYTVKRIQEMEITSGSMKQEVFKYEQYKLSMEVKEKTKENISLIVQLKTYRQKTSVHPLDSTELANLQPNGLDSLISKHILNRSYFVKMDFHGNILTVTPPRFTFKWYEMDSLNYEALIEFKQKPTIAALLSEVLVVYPRNPVIGNDTWNNLAYMDAGVPVAIYKTMQVREFEKKKIQLSEKAKVEADTQLMEAMENKEEISVHGKGTGSLFVDKKSYRLLSKTCNYQINGSIKIPQGTADITNAFRVSVESN